MEVATILKSWSVPGRRHVKNSNHKMVPEGLKQSPSGGPDGSSTSHGTTTAYWLR